VSEHDRIGRSDARRLLDEGGIEASRALGQNFVVDPNTVDRIVRLARVGPGDTVVEIGAGLGSLTLALADSGASVTAIEIDRRLLPILSDVVGDRVRVVEGDAMTLDWSQIVGTRTDVVVVSNLPYNIATPLVITLLERVRGIERLVVMVQREVAERFVAPPGSKTYGAASVRIAYHATARILGTVSPEVFVPRPRVTSAIVEITRLPATAVSPEIASYREIDELVRAGFGGRRKMLRRSLLGLVDSSVFAAAGIDPTARAEELGVERWGTLASCRRRSAPSRS
jgi:16S rRNA (adenine1518-N6/adenine1519-N6)-dimethyltransferase